MKNKLFLLVSFFAVVFLLGSCLKDDVGEYWKDDLAGKMYATVANAGLQTLSLKPVAGEVNFEFLLNIATDALPTEDITLTLAIDTAAVTYYNQTNIKWNKANPTAPPKVVYSKFPYVEVLTPTLTIPKGTRNVIAKAKVWGADVLNACDNFMSAISIVSAKTASGQDVTIAGNMKSNLMALPISNPYAAKYHSTGVFTHPTAGARDIDEDKDVKTIDCKTVAMSAGDLGGEESTWVLVTVNADNSLTFAGGLSASQPYLPMTGLVNKYDPATKSFTLNYYYVGSGGNRVMQEVVVRK